jgi:hypothetical protein
MINVAISVKPRANKWLALTSSFLVWGGSVLSAKAANIIVLLLGALLALAGSWLLALSLTFIWKVKNEELSALLTSKDVVVVQGCVTPEECLSEQDCSQDLKCHSTPAGTADLSLQDKPGAGKEPECCKK